MPQGGTLTIGAAQSGAQSFSNEVFGRFAGDRDAALDDKADGIALAFAAPDPAIAAGLGLSLPAKTDIWAWGRLYGERSAVNGNGALDYTGRAIGGAGGLETKPDANSLLGIAFGLGHSRLKTQADDRGTLDAYRLSLYSQYRLGPVFFGGTLGGAYNRGHAQSAPDPITFQYIEGSFGGYQLGASVMGGYRFLFGTLAVEPWAGFDYERLHQNAFTQSGPGFADLHVDAVSIDTGRTRLATRIVKTMPLDDGKSLELRAELGWAHDILDVTPSTLQQIGTGTPFIVTGPTVGRDAVFGGVGAKLALQDNVDLMLDLSGDARDKAWSQAVVIGLRIKW